VNLLFINTSKGDAVYGIEHWMLLLGQTLVREGHGVVFAGRPAHQLLAAAQAAGLRVFPLRIRSGLEWLDALRLRSLLWRERIACICVKTYKEARLAALARLGLPIRLLERRGALGDVRNRFRDRWMLRWCCDALVVPSRALQEDFTRWPWLDPRRVGIVPHGVVLEEYAAVTPRAAQPPGGGRVIFVGRLHPIKGTDVLLEAWARVQRAVPRARLCLVGDGARAQHEQWARDHGVAGTVEFAGFAADVKPWIAGADLLVAPSRAEGAAYVLLQAQALGVPVVATRIGGNPEYLREDVSGLLVAPEDPAALAQAILDLLRDPQRRARLGAAGRRHVAEHFDMATALRRFLALANGHAN